MKSQGASSMKRLKLTSLSCKKPLEGGGLRITPLEINIELKNHPFAKEIHLEIHLPNLHYCVPCSFSTV